MNCDLRSFVTHVNRCINSKYSNEKKCIVCRKFTGDFDHVIGHIMNDHKKLISGKNVVDENTTQDKSMVQVKNYRSAAAQSGSKHENVTSIEIETENSEESKDENEDFLSSDLKKRLRNTGVKLVAMKSLIPEKRSEDLVIGEKKASKVKDTSSEISDDTSIEPKEDHSYDRETISQLKLSKKERQNILKSKEKETGDIIKPRSAKKKESRSKGKLSKKIKKKKGSKKDTSNTKKLRISENSNEEISQDSLEFVTSIENEIEEIPVMKETRPVEIVNVEDLSETPRKKDAGNRSEFGIETPDETASSSMTTLHHIKTIQSKTETVVSVVSTSVAKKKYFEYNDENQNKQNLTAITDGAIDDSRALPNSGSFGEIQPNEVSKSVVNTSHQYKSGQLEWTNEVHKKKVNAGNNSLHSKIKHIEKKNQRNPQKLPKTRPKENQRPFAKDLLKTSEAKTILNTKSKPLKLMKLKRFSGKHKINLNELSLRLGIDLKQLKKDINTNKRERFLKKSQNQIS